MAARRRLLAIVRDVDRTDDLDSLCGDAEDLARYLESSDENNIDSLNAVALLYYERTTRGIADEIDPAIAAWERANRLVPEGSLAPVVVTNLATALRWRFSHFGRSADLVTASALLRDALLRLDTTEEMYWPVVRGLASTLRLKPGRSAELDELIPLLRAGSEHGDVESDRNADALVSVYRSRFQLTGNRADIEAAADVSRRLVENVDADDDRWVVHTVGLAMGLDDLADLAGDERLRREAEEYAFAALERLGREVAPSTALLHLNIAGRMRTRALHARDPEPAREAIAVCREVARLRPLSTDSRAAAWNGAAQSAQAVYQLTGDLMSLRNAARWHRCASRYLRDDDRDKPLIDGNAGAAMMLLHERTGYAGHLASAIALFRAVVRHPALDTRGRPGAVSNLANALGVRFVRSGHRKDSDEAIECYRDAIASRISVHPDHSDIAMWMANLGGALQERYRRLGDPDSLVDGARVLEQAAERAGPDHPARLLVAGNLAAVLCELFERAPTDHRNEFDRAMALYAELDASMSASDPRRAGMCHNIAAAWRALYSATGDIDHARQASTWAESAVATLADGHGDAPLVWKVYGDSLGDLYEAAPDDEVLGKALRAWLDAQRQPNSETSPAAMSAADTAGYVLGQLDRWNEADSCYRFARRVLENLLILTLDRNDIETWLHECDGLAADAAFAAVRAGDIPGAVEHLETLRSVQTRMRLELLPEPSRQIAGRPADLIAELETISAALRDPAAAVDSRQDLAARRQTVIAEIRKLDGLASFLQQPSLAELAGALVDEVACYVSVSAFGGLVIAMVRGQEPVAVVVDGTIRAEANEVVRGLLSATQGSAVEIAASAADVCAWIGERVLPGIRAALAELDLSSSTRRLRLIPIGALAFLPIHAGVAREEDGTIDAPLADWDVTYLPSLAHLARCRSNSLAEIRSVVCLTGTDAQGEVLLAQADSDRRAVGSLFADVHHVSGDNDEARTAIIDADWLHTATHGIFHPEEPLNSGLVIHDTSILRIGDILTAGVRPRRVAVLAACSTASPGSALPDEVVSLPGALLEVGFAGVGCAGWPIPDRVSADHTTAFYQQLRSAQDDLPAAWAAATRELRSRRPSPWQWGGFCYWGV